jgi:hypothetical protein
VVAFAVDLEEVAGLVSDWGKAVRLLTARDLGIPLVVLAVLVAGGSDEVDNWEWESG